MDKQTLSNYGWIVIAVLVLSVMIALATPFGEYIKAGVESTTAGLFETSEKAMNVVGMSAKETSKWQDRKWVAFGTSLTATNNTGAPDGTPTGKYTPYLTELSGMNLTNRGVSGGSISGHILYYIHYYKKDYKDADLITIEGSVNDWVGNGVPLGTVGDTVPYVKNVHQDVVDFITSLGGSESGTFAGACYQTFKIAKENAPNSVIVFLTDNTGRRVPSTGGNCSRDILNGLGLSQQDYIDTAIAVAESMGITVIDAGAKSMINEEHPEYLIDHIHHTELGGQKYAEAIWSELKNITPPPLKTKPEIYTGNYFDKNASDIENGGIYVSSGSWLANASFFESGYIKIPVETELYLFGVPDATHFNFYDIDTKERVRGLNNGVVSGNNFINFGFYNSFVEELGYTKDYIYVRFGAKTSYIDDIVITVNSDGSIS